QSDDLDRGAILRPLLVPIVALADLAAIRSNDRGGRLGRGETVALQSLQSADLRAQAVELVGGRTEGGDAILPALGDHAGYPEDLRGLLDGRAADHLDLRGGL